MEQAQLVVIRVGASTGARRDIEQALQPLPLRRIVLAFHGRNAGPLFARRVSAPPLKGWRVVFERLGIDGGADSAPQPRALAILLAVFVGGLGAHSFYLPRKRRSIWNRTRSAQMSLGFNGAFCPMILPLFHGSQISAMLVSDLPAYQGAFAKS